MPDNHPACIEKIMASKQMICALLPSKEQQVRFFNVLVHAVIDNPKLHQCTPDSIFIAAKECAALGLEPGGTLAQCHFVPFKGKATLIAGYRGLMTLMRRGDSDIQKIDALAVREKDYFEVSDQGLMHKYDFSERGKIIGYYCLVEWRGGARKWTTMDLDEVQRIRSKSLSKDKGPWVTDPEAMGIKSVIRKCAKQMELAPEAAGQISQLDSNEFRFEEIDVPDMPVGVEQTKAAILKKEKAASPQGGAPLKNSPID